MAGRASGTSRTDLWVFPPSHNVTGLKPWTCSCTYITYTHVPGSFNWVFSLTVKLNQGIETGKLFWVNWKKYKHHHYALKWHVSACLHVFLWVEFMQSFCVSRSADSHLKFSQNETSKYQFTSLWGHLPRILQYERWEWSLLVHLVAINLVKVKSRAEHWSRKLAGISVNMWPGFTLQAVLLPGFKF